MAPTSITSCAAAAAATSMSPLFDITAMVYENNPSTIYQFITHPQMNPNAKSAIILKKPEPAWRRIPMLDASVFFASKQGDTWNYFINLLLQRPDLIIKPDSMAMAINCKRFDFALLIARHVNMGDINEPCIFYSSKPKSILQIAIEKIAPLDVVMAILNRFPNVSGLSNKLLEFTPNTFEAFEDMMNAVSQCPGFVVDAETLIIIMRKFKDAQDGENTMLYFVLKTNQYTHDREAQKLIQVAFNLPERIARLLDIIGYKVQAADMNAMNAMNASVAI